MKRPILMCIAIAAAALAVAGCGSSNKSSSSSSSSSSTSAPAAGGGGATLTLSADPTQLKFNTSSLSAKAGNVTLWWRAELLLVIAVKVRRILVADAESGARRVQVFAEH